MSNKNCMQGQDDCKYITKISYEIIDTTTDEAVDVTCYENKIPVAYVDAIFAKYVHLERIYCRSAEKFKGAENVMEALANWNKS